MASDWEASCSDLQGEVHLWVVDLKVASFGGLGVEAWRRRDEEGGLLDGLLGDGLLGDGLEWGVEVGIDLEVA